MAGAAQAASPTVTSGACSHPIQLALRRQPLRISVLCSRVSRHLIAFRHHHQESRRPWVSAVSEVTVDGATNTAAAAVTKPGKESEDKTPQESSTTPQESSTTAKEATISALMADVANLIKLVDTRDIVELELKHQDYELVLKKKEALSPPPVAPPVVSAPVGQAAYPAYAPPPPPPAAPSPSAAPAAAPASAPSPAPPQPVANLPRILSPMAGTFYKSPAPGEPAFVKVGDKVSKGQVICIVEAMKLMNEIEADQSGTIVEILAEEGKPVAVDTPLFAIKP